MNFGESIKKIRLSRRYNQAYVAGELGISIRAYSKLENNETELTVWRLFDISGILGVNISEFILSNEKKSFNPTVIEFNTGNKLLINQVERTIELYNLLIKEKDEHISELKQRIVELDSINKEFKMQLSKVKA